MLLNEIKCVGKLCWEGKTVDVLFYIVCRADGSIEIGFQDILFGEDTVWLTEIAHSEGIYEPQLVLTAKSSDGRMLNSKSVSVHCGSRSDQTGAWITARGSASELTLEAQTSEGDEGVPVLQEGEGRSLNYAIPART